MSVGTDLSVHVLEMLMSQAAFYQQAADLSHLFKIDHQTWATCLYSNNHHIDGKIVPLEIVQFMPQYIIAGLEIEFPVFMETFRAFISQGTCVSNI